MKRQWLLFLLLAALLLALFPEQAQARRRGRVSFPSSPRSIPSRPDVWGSSRVPSGRSSGGSWGGGSGGWGSAPRQGIPQSSPRPRVSGADQELMNRARQQGTVFSSRQDAARAMERDLGQQYSSQFPARPSQRPDYIPNRTTVDGREYDVVYDQRQRGYGYYDGGTWNYFNAFRDMAILNMLMNQHGYMWGRPAAVPPGGSGGGGGAGSGLLIVVVIVASAIIVSRAGAPRRRIAVAGGRGNPWGPPSFPPPAGYHAPPARPDAAKPGMFDANDPVSWRTIRPGSTLTLKDQQTIEEMLADGETHLALGRDYGVRTVTTIYEQHALAEWRIFELENAQDEDQLFLIAKMVDRAVNIGVFFADEGFTPGDRQDMLNSQRHWLFDAPANPASFQLNDLHFATVLQLTVEEEGGAKQIEFHKLGQMEFHGRVAMQPVSAGAGNLMATVAEYQAEAPTTNPRLFVYEIGKPSNLRGGNIQFVQGSLIRNSEVDVLPVM